VSAVPLQCIFMSSDDIYVQPVPRFHERLLRSSRVALDIRAEHRPEHHWLPLLCYILVSRRPVVFPLGHPRLTSNVMPSITTAFPPWKPVHCQYFSRYPLFTWMPAADTAFLSRQNDMAFSLLGKCLIRSRLHSFCIHIVLQACNLELLLHSEKGCP
jgi:hypothetical protein